MIADFKPYAEYKETGLPWLGLFARREEISADILAIEKEAEGLLAGTIGEEK
jgi:hypothetical protein